jgi:hypothetical protein
MSGLRPGEKQLYLRTLEIARESLGIAMRTNNLVTKLSRLDLAEQKLEDALWLWPEGSADEYRAGIDEIRKSRREALQEYVLKEIRYQLERARKTKSGNVRFSALSKAALYLGYCVRDLERTEEIDSAVRELAELGGEVTEPHRPQPVSATYQRPAQPAGCGASSLLIPYFLLEHVLRSFR